MASKPVPVQIAVRSNPARYSFAGNARLLNAYAEKQGDDAKAPLAVLPCPGMVLFSSVTDTPNRGTIFCEDLGCIYSVHSSGVFKVLSTGVATRIGTVPGNDQVQMSRNQASPVQISIHSTSGEYYIEADIVKAVSDIDVTTETVVSQDNVKGYTVYLNDVGKFIYSAVNNCNDVDGLDFATAEQSADGGTRVKANGSDVFFFGVQTIEPWRVTADPDLPFELIGGAVQNRGMIAPLAVVESDNTLMFPGEDNSFYRLQSYAPVKISTHAQDRLLEGDANREAVQGFSWNFQGHAFSSWSGTDWSITYDAASGAWHDRQSYNLANWRARNGVRAWGKTIVGDSQTGNLYYFDADTFVEGGDPLIWGVDTPYLHATGANGGIVDALYLDVATGVGLVTATEQGFDPVLMLSWSTDGGKTFKGFRQLKLGKRGAGNTRLRTRRLGRFADKGIMFRIRVSDPVLRALLSITADVRPLKK